MPPNNLFFSCFSPILADTKGSENVLNSYNAIEMRWKNPVNVQVQTFIAGESSVLELSLLLIFDLLSQGTVFMASLLEVSWSTIAQIDSNMKLTTGSTE